MTIPIELHTRPDLDLSGSLVIFGAPGLGFVGSLATRYLVDTLKMERIGGMHSAHFPPYTVVENGRPLHLVRLHHLETACGMGLKCDQLVVVSSEMMPVPQLFHPLAEAVVDWARSIDASMVVIPDAYVREAEDAGDKKPLRGIASTDRALEFLNRAKVQPLSDGVVVGLTSTLLTVSEREGLDAVAVLTAADSEHPDARAAAEIVELLDEILPGIKIDTSPLVDQAERIETKVKELRAQMAAQARQVGTEETPPAVSMFH